MGYLSTQLSFVDIHSIRLCKIIQILNVYSFNIPISKKVGDE